MAIRRAKDRKSSPQANPGGAPEAVVREPSGSQTIAPFPIVGIGASAGGLEPFGQILRALPADTGMAFVLLQHLDPTHASMLTEILSRATVMPVAEVTDQMMVQPNHVYVIPPGVTMGIDRGTLRLTPRREAKGQHRPIDYFLRSLAEDQGHRGIGVILSGSATDGTLGLEAFTQMLHALPVDTGRAFVLVQHLAPTHASMLTEILSRATSMPVTEVKDQMPVEPNHVGSDGPGGSPQLFY